MSQASISEVTGSVRLVRLMDWPSRLGLRPPENVVAQVERLREETGETGEPVRPRS